MSKKSVAVTEDQYPAEAPDFLKNQEQGKGRGNEAVSADDMTIPRLEIIQDLSPQHKESKEKYIDGAKAGMSFNTATGELYTSALMVVPVFFRKEWVLWKDRKEGSGGFGGAYQSEAEANKERMSLPDADKWEAVETHQQFSLLVLDNSDLANPVVEQAVISMAKSKRKISRGWNTMIRSCGGDRFSRVYKMEVVEAQNANGDDYYNWKVSPAGFVTEAIYKLAEETYESVSNGLIDVSRVDTAEDTSVVDTKNIPDDEFGVDDV